MLNTRQLSDDIKYVSERCREFRKKANMSQYDLSEITGLSPNTIARLENEQRVPDLEQILRYCYALDLPITDFFPASASNLGTSKQFSSLKTSYGRLSDKNKEFVLSAMGALMDGLLAQQFLQR